MCHLRNIAMCYYQESVTTRQTDRQTDARQSDPFVPLCLAGTQKRSLVKVFNIFAIWKIMGKNKKKMTKTIKIN